jgi:hypothetical protein
MVQLCEDVQVKGYCTCGCPVHFAFAWAANHRPYPLPVQWLHVRDPGPLDGARAQQLDPTTIRPLVRHSALLQAHLSVLGASILCLPPPRLLLGAATIVPLSEHPVFQLCKVGNWYCRHLRLRIWSICCLGPDGTGVPSFVPVLTWSMSCVLGPECMGNVLIRGSSSHLRYHLYLSLHGHANPNSCSSTWTEGRF